MPSFIPYQLIHAHHPLPPPIPNSIPEFRVPSDRPYPSASYLSSLPLHPAHAHSVARDPTTGVLARSLQNGHCLELSNFYLTVDPNIPHLDRSDTFRILFPDALRPLDAGCIVPSRRDARLYVLVVSTSNIVYRINFLLGSLSIRDHFVFSVLQDWCEEWTIPDEVIGACGGIGAVKVTNEDTIVLGGDDGGIVRLSRTGHRKNGSWTASHHRASSRYRLPSLFSRSATSDEQIISISEFEHEDELAILYTLSRDRKLRAWNSATGVCMKTMDVRMSSSTSQELVVRGSQPQTTGSASILPSTTIPLIKIIQHPSHSSRYSHLVVIFIPASFSTLPGTFIVYRAGNGSHDLVYAGERPASSAGAELRGFEIIPPFRKDGIDSGWRLWTVWDTKGAVSSETCIMDDIFQFSTFVGSNDNSLLCNWQNVTLPSETEQFDAAYFDNIVSLESPNPTEPLENSDISSTFITHLFYPGRFSQLSLQTVTEEYINQLSKSYQIDQETYFTLSARLIAIVGSHLEMETNPQTGAPEVDVYRKALKLEWLGIWARVRDLDRQARWPVAVSTLDQEIAIFSREGVSIPVPEDAVGLVLRTKAETLEELSEGSLRKLYPSLSPPQARSNIGALTSAGSLFSAALAAQEVEDGGNALDSFTEHVDETLAASPEVPVEALCGSIWDELVDPYLTDDDREAISSALSLAPSVRRGINQALDLLVDFSSHLGGVTSESQYSGFGSALITSNICQTVANRYRFAKNVLLVAIHHLSECPDPANDDDEAEELIEVLARSLATYHRYRVLKMLCEQTGEASRKRLKGRRRKLIGDELLAAGFGSLKVGENDSIVEDRYEPSYSLIHCLISRQLISNGIEKSTSLSQVFQTSMSVLEGLGLIARGQIEVEPQSSDVKLAFAILVDGHALAAGMFADLYPLSPGMAYIKGRASLEVGTVENAVLCFEQASSGCHDGSVKVVLPSCNGSGASEEYYRHVCQLFDQHGLHEPVINFGKLAIKAMTTQDISSRDIWTRVFLSQIALGLYEDAYSVLTSSPFSDLKIEFLGQLISVMCEDNQVGRLNSLGFIGFQEKVEEMLKFKARNSDPLRFPNYYKVLYSWHISRGNYRSAGEIMYLQGRRLGESSIGGGGKLPPFELSAMKARSYLAAINALSLVEKRNAWVSVPTTIGRPVRGLKRRKMSSYIPEDEFTKDKRSIDLVTLGDIQMEYTLVLAQLRLANYIKDLQEHGVTVSAEEVVGLFTQRGMYDLAQSSAASLDVDMIDLFQNLAGRCVELSRLSSDMIDNPSSNFLKMSPLTSRLQGPPSLLSLKYLETSLSRHDSSKTNWKYTIAVSETFFQLNQDLKTGWKMPAWLVENEMKRDPEGWISRALEFGWVREGVEWCIELLSRATPPELLPSKRSNTAYIPYNLIDRVIKASQEGDEKDDRGLQGRVEFLRKEVERRVEGLGNV